MKTIDQILKIEAVVLNNSRKDDPDKDYLTVIDIARAGNAPKELVDYIREKQLLKKALA